MGKRDFEIRQDPRWPNAHIQLRRLYDERVRPTGMTERQFAEEYGLGKTQGIVWQYLNGYVKLNIEAATKFAQGLRCNIKDISPEMDRLLRAALGLGRWSKPLGVALLAACLAGPEPVGAVTYSGGNGGGSMYIMLNRLLRLIARLFRTSGAPVMA